MTSGKRKMIERPEGQGLIQFPDGKTIRVRYALVVVRIIDDDADTGGLTGQAEIWGTIEAGRDEGTQNLSGKSFIVKTGDGRCMQALAKRGNLLTREWEIVSSGTKGLEPC
jgi:hypothetical protein